MNQKSGKLFNLFVVLSMLLGMVVTPALAASGSEAQAAPAAPVTQEDAAAKIDPQVLLEIKESGATEFFVWMKEKADLSPAANLKTKQEKGQFVFDALRATAERTQKDLRAVLDAQGVEYRSFYIANKILVRSGGEALAFELAARPDVAQITPNQKYQLQEPFKSTNVPESPEAIEPNITFIYAPDVWGMGIDGQGTVMAGNDTGLDWDHPAIINKYRGWDGATADHNYNWWDATGTYPSVPNDGHGHGTHTTGTMVGDDGGDNQIGVAPGAQTIHCKNMTDGGSGDDGTFSECFEWDLAPWDLTGANPNPALAPDAINNSWGYWGGNAPQFEDEVDALQAAGVVVEVSSGNEGSACTTLRSPGDYQQVMTTGSVNHAAPFPGSLTGFSSRGPSLIDPADYMPDIMAPGENIRSSVPGGGYEGGWSGTSMAGPHATALIGLMWDANPALKGQVDLTYQIIQETAEPLTGVTGSNCGGDYTVGPNNDWGFGTINALAAVEAAIALGGAGFLEGTVTDSATTDPLAGVSIVATKSPTQTYSTMTDVFGYYGKYLPEGTYEVNASKFGYIPETVTDLVITEDVTTTLDFALDPAPSATIYGNVYDSATGWPLYAQITVAGVPDGAFWNDPETGYYEVTLPEGSTYDFTIEAWVGGYLPYNVSIGPLAGDTEENFYLDANLATCSAPGYEFGGGGFYQPFDATTTPPGWTVVNNGGTCTWAFNNPGGRTNNTGGTGNFAVADSDACGSGTTMNTTLYSPIVDVSALPAINFEFKYDYDNLSTSEVAAVDVSADGGATWTNLFTWNTDQLGPATYSQDLTGLLGGSTQAQIRWQYVAPGWDWWWEVDDARLGSTAGCNPPESGGLVVGNVYDANTSNALAGATVENEAGYSTTTEATADPAVGDGFYTLFSPAGEQTFTASFTDAYGSDVDVVDVVDGGTVLQNFWLPAGWLVPDPDTVSVNVELYQTTFTPVQLLNMGDLDLTFEVSEKDQGYIPGMLAGEDILVVAYDTSSAPVAEAALAALGYTYLEVTATTFAAMPVDDLLEYLAVVYVGIPYTGGPQEKAMEYMDAGGSFMVADNDLGYAYGSSVFYTTYLQATYLTDAGSDGVVVGTDIMAGISTDISGDPYPDDFTAGPDGVGIFDAPSGNLAGIRVERDDYLAIYLAWDFYYTGAAQQVPIMEAAMGYLAASDVPWLSVDPTSGAISANSAEWMDVYFDAGVPEVTEPGQYLAELQIKNNTPYGRMTVPVTMNVTAPAYLGKLEGTVNSMGYCDANPFPAEGALVVIEDTYGITYTATADASGYYYKWLDEDGSPYTISVTAPEHDPGYADGVIVVGQGTTTQDFDLRWLVPCVGSDPDALSATLPLGANETQVLTLENLGGGAMDFEFQERDNGFNPSQVAVHIPRYEGDIPVSTEPVSMGRPPVAPSAGNSGAPTEFQIPNGAEAFALDVYPGLSLVNFPDVDVPGTWNVVAPVPQFHPAADFLNGDFSTLYAVDYDTNEFVSIDTTTGVRTVIGATTPSGNWSGLSGATDGTLYGMSSVCGTESTLYTIDPATGALTTIGNVGAGTCIIDIAINAAGEMYGVDIISDNLYQIDTATGAGTVIGYTGVSANYAQGMDFEDETGILYWAAYTSAGEMRIIDTTTGNSVYVGAFPGGNEVDGLAFATGGASADVPWLSEDPLAGTVPADDSLDTDITFDAGQVTQPGEYYADLIVSSNDPENNKYAIPVVMTVTAPEDWGKLEGTVTSLGYCDANPALVEGAEVLVTTSSGMTYTLTTDVNGYYVSWFPEGESPLTIKVTADEHTEGYVEDVVITGGATTTLDFDLRWLMPCVGADPTTFSVDVPVGTLLTENLALTNSGAEATSFEVSEQPVTGAAAAVPAKVTPLGSRLDLSLSGSPNLAGAAQPWAPSGDVELVLDDGSAEDSIGLTAGGQFIWFNRFTPTEDQFPLVIDQISLLMNNTTSVGASLQILLYEDTDGDGDPGTGAVLLGYEYVTVQYNDMMTWNVYDLASPVTLFSPGDVLIGVVNRSGSSGLLDFPAAIDQSPSSQYRSWIGYYGANPPEEPALPAPDLWGVIDDFGLSGNWTLRASGYVGSQDVPWLSEDPVTGTLEADSFFDIAVTFDSMTYTVGTTLDAMLKVKTDDENSPIEIPVTMNVVAWEYGVDAMLENDALSGAPGETVTYTVMVTNTGNVADVFDVVVSDDDWTTQAPPSVALGAGESAALEVTVEIPAGAADGDWDEATCTFTSQGDPTKTAAATMTTTAEVPYEFGVELAPATDAKAGAPGAMVAYVLQLTNTGDVTDTFDLAVGSVEGWLVDFSAIEFTLGAGEMAEVTVHVTVPADAVEGDGDVTTVTATSQGDGSLAASSVLTTTAVFPKIFLPVIPQGFTTP